MAKANEKYDAESISLEAGLRAKRGRRILHRRNIAQWPA